MTGSVPSGRAVEAVGSEGRKPETLPTAGPSRPRPGSITVAAALADTLAIGYAIRYGLDGWIVVVVEDTVRADPAARTVPLLTFPASYCLAVAVLVVVTRLLAEAIRRGFGLARTAAWMVAGVGLLDAVGLVKSRYSIRSCLDLPALGKLVPGWYPPADAALPVGSSLVCVAIVVLLVLPSSNQHFRSPRLSAPGDSPVIHVPRLAVVRRFIRWRDRVRPRTSTVLAGFAVVAVVTSVAVLTARDDTADPRCLRSFDFSAEAVAFSPDGRLLAVGVTSKFPAHGGRGMVRLWDPATGRAAGRPLVGQGDSVAAVAFSPDGELLASGGGDGTVRLWDPVTGRMVGQPLVVDGGEDPAALAVAFSPDGKTLASNGHDGTVRLWNPVTALPVGRAFGERLSREDLAFSPDGRTVAQAGLDGVCLWDVPA